MAKGESKMLWYAEVVLSYIIREKQSDMERRHGSPHIITTFFSHNFFSRLYHRVPQGALGKSD